MEELHLVPREADLIQDLALVDLALALEAQAVLV
jgi:hypothetical protein